MSSFLLSKAQLVVLFDCLLDSLGHLSLPVSIRDLPEVNPEERQQILSSFYASRLLDSQSPTFRPDRGLDPFLLPIVKTKTILLWNHGVDGVCTFNASLYFSPVGVVALRDRGGNGVRFQTLDSVEDLLLFLSPDFAPTAKHPYISYLRIEPESSVIHCAVFSPEGDSVHISEGKRGTADTSPVEASSVVTPAAYQQLLKDKLQEVYGDIIGR